MHRKKVAFYLAAIVLCVTAVAFAKATRLELENGNKHFLDPDSSGVVVVNCATGAEKTEIQVNCSGLEPGVTYAIGLTNPSDFPIAEATAGPNGKIAVHISVECCISGRRVAVGRTGAGGGIILRSPIVP